MANPSTATAQQPAQDATTAPQQPAAPADGAKPKRKPSVRLTPAQKREKAIAGIDAEVSKAYSALTKAAEGYMFAREMDRARACLDACQVVMEIATAVKPTDANADDS